MNTLHSRTPTVSVLDNRGLGVRDIVYHRHPGATDITDERVTRHTFTPAGHLQMSRSPRQYDLMRADPSVLPDREIISSLSGQPLKVSGCDDGTTLTFHDAADRPLLAVTAAGVTRRWGYEDPGLPGRLLSVSEALPGQPPHLHETLAWGSNTAYEKELNLAGQCTERRDECGLYWLTSVSLTGQPLTRLQQLLADGDEEEDRRTRLPAELLYTHYRYDATGELLTQTDARGNRQRYARDVAGQLKGSWLTPAGGTERVILQSVRYTATGRVLEEVHGNGVVTTYTYEPQTQRLTGIHTARPAGHPAGTKVLQDLRYEYDPVGNVVSVRNDAEETRFWRNQKVVPESRYVCDSLYQLVSATGREMAGGGQQGSSLPDVTLFDNATYTNYTRTWAYDRNGNLTQIRHSAPATGNNHTTDITVSQRSNRGVLRTLAGKPEEVDALFSPGGHQQQLLPGQALHWTLREELHRVTLVDRGEESDEEVYRYDANALRVIKTRTQRTGNSTRTDEVVYLDNLELRSTCSGTVQTAALVVSVTGSARLLHWESGKPEGISNDQIRYGHSSLNEGCGLETDEAGRVISLEEYYPYGGTAVWAARSAVEADYKTVRYSGKERDVTGLYYYDYRYYQPWSGRWLSADPAGTVDGLNLFRMCCNNPCSGIDNDGRMFKRITSMRQRKSPMPSVTVTDYPLPDSERVSGENGTLTPTEIKQYKRAISEGTYPQNIIRHNFLHGKKGLPAPNNMPPELNTKEMTSEVVTGNFLQAVDNLKSYAGGKAMYRGTMVPEDMFKGLQPGSVLQSHQLSFFSESDLVARAFIDSSENKVSQPVLFKVKDIPEDIFKEGLLSTFAYDSLKVTLSKRGVSKNKLEGIGSTVKEIISTPGALFQVIELKQIKSDIHKEKITQVNLKFSGVSKGVHDQALF